MKILSLTYFLISSIWAGSNYESKAVYFNNQGTLQYGSIRLDTSKPAPSVIPVQYSIYKGVTEWNHTSGSVKVSYPDVIQATSSLNIELNKESYTLSKGSIVIGEDGEFYVVVDVFGSTGKVAMNKLTSNPNTRNQDPKYFNRGNNTFIFDKSFVRAVNKNCFSSYCQGQKHSTFGNYTFCEYLGLLQSQGKRISSRTCMGGADSRKEYRVDYVFSDGTLIIERYIRANLPKLLETYLPPDTQESRAVQGK